MSNEMEDTDGYINEQLEAIGDLIMQRGLTEAERASSPVGDERNDSEPEKSQCYKEANGMMIVYAIFSISSNSFLVSALHASSLKLFCAEGSTPNHQPLLRYCKLARRHRGT